MRLRGTASTASATTACSPAAPTPTTSSKRAACSTYRRHSPRPAIPTAPRPRAQAALAPVSVLRRSHDHHRDFPARLLAAYTSRGNPRSDQDRHIMIRLGSMQYPSAAHLLRRLSVGNEHARCRAAHDSRRVLPSPLRNSDSAPCNRPTRFVASTIAYRKSSQPSSAKDRQPLNPHSV